MYNSKAIREKIAELFATAEALNKLAADEERQLTDDEKSEFDGILAQIGNDGIDGEAKSGLWADVDKAEKFESIRNRLSAPVNNVPAPVRADAPNQSIRGKLTCRANLRAYQRDDRESLEDAYKAGRWLAASLFGDGKSRQWCDEHGMTIRAAQTEGSNSKGGFLVPEELSRAIIDLRESYGVFRRWTRVIPMASDHMVIPRRLSGVTAYAVGEADTITASDKEWNRVELTAKKWAALTKYSSELAEDAFIDLADDLADEMAYAFATKEDQAAFIGDGTSTYHGVSGVITKVSDGNHAGSIYTAASGNTAFSTLDLDDFEGALGKLPEYAAMRRPAWFISRVGYYASMSRLMNAGGGNNNDDLGTGPGMNFLGLPVVISQVLNSTTTAQTDTNIAFVGDLALASTMGDRRQFEVAVSEHAYFSTDELGIRGTERVAINIHDLGDSSNAGPVVVLRTPSS